MQAALAGAAQQGVRAHGTARGVPGLRVSLRGAGIPRVAKPYVRALELLPRWVAKCAKPLSFVGSMSRLRTRVRSEDDSLHGLDVLFRLPHRTDHRLCRPCRREHHMVTLVQGMKFAAGR